MKKIYVVSEPSKPFRDGTSRSRAWLILRAFDGLPVEQFIKACAVMEKATQTGGDPEGWVKFFTATGRYQDRPGNPNASEKLAEVLLGKPDY